jgi:hypothetical protein
MPSTNTHIGPNTHTKIHQNTIMRLQSLLAILPFLVAVAAAPIGKSSSPHTSLLPDPFVCLFCGSLPQCLHDVVSNGKIDRLRSVHPNHLKKMANGEIGDTVDMRAERDVNGGGEVFSCYEEGIGQGKLLVEWGFVGGGRGGDGGLLKWDAMELLGAARGGANEH